MIRLVILESPYQGDVDANCEYGRACVRDSILRGEAPLASHLLYTQAGILDDNDAVERRIGIDAGLAWHRLKPCATVVYTDKGISPGMAIGIKAAHDANTPAEYRSLFTREKTN